MPLYSASIFGSVIVPGEREAAYAPILATVLTFSPPVMPCGARRMSPLPTFPLPLAEFSAKPPARAPVSWMRQAAVNWATTALRNDEHMVCARQEA